jgi:DNA-binding LacI/PurR family transcriptional regulator
MLLASEAALSNIRERIQGYREALAEAGLSRFENAVVAGANETDYVKPALHQLLTKERRPSAIFAVPELTRSSTEDTKAARKSHECLGS